jgi:hypothetical protein
MPTIHNAVPSLNFADGSKSRLRVVGTDLEVNQDVVVLHPDPSTGQTPTVRWTGQLKNVKSNKTRATARLECENPIPDETERAGKKRSKKKKRVTEGTDNVSVTIEEEDPVTIPVDLYNEPEPPP